LARPSQDQGLMPSLIERLADPAMLASGALEQFSARRMMDSIRRDLEDLFNSHNAARPEVLESEPLRSSILAYGMPDLPSLSLAAGPRQKAVGQIIEDVIGRYEPRLRDVRVVMAEPDKDSPHRIRLRIEARLNVDPSPEIEFETILELTTGQTSIRNGPS
jgi:type VI secretion system protein ImpF